MEEHAEFQVTTSEQVTQILGAAPDMVLAKLGDNVDPSAQEFVKRSPLVFIATSDSTGCLDVSPKGDAPGFVQVVDQQTLLIPERKGNNLAFGIRNIIDTGRIGLVFVIPGERETLRINGTATISNDPALLDQLATPGKPSLLCTTVAVEECFFHCGKAMIRSKTWKPETWESPPRSLMIEQLVQTMGGDESLHSVVHDAIEQNYVDELY